MSHYTMLSNWYLYASAQNWKPAENRLLLQMKVGKNSRYFVGVFSKTIIPLAIVRYEMIIANEARTISYQTRTRGMIVK